MNAELNVRTAPSIIGHMIALSAGHSIAIYERNREGFVVEFRDGRASLEYAGSWFRFNSGVLRCLRRRTALTFFMPLTPEVLRQIERLHAEREARHERILAVPRRIAAAAQTCLTSVMSHLRGGASKRSQTLG